MCSQDVETFMWSNLRDRVSSDKVLRKCGLEIILLSIVKMRMAWFGHVYRRGGNDPLCRVREFEAQGRRPRGRPMKTIVCEVIFQLPDSLRLQQRKKLDRGPSFHV